MKEYKFSSRIAFAGAGVTPTATGPAGSGVALTEYRVDGGTWTPYAPFHLTGEGSHMIEYRSHDGVGNLETARMGETAGAVTVPHNWGSQVGLFMGLQMARAVKSIPAAEDDRPTCDVIVAEGYEFRGGRYTVPEAPGLGLRVDDKVYQDKYMAAKTVIGGK